MRSKWPAFLLLLTILTGCGPSATRPVAVASLTPPITSLPPTSVSHTPFPKSTPPYPAPATAIAPTSHAYQTVTDPAGQFSVQIPADWLADPYGGYTGVDGFYRMSYLPEMAYTQRSIRVCEDLANGPLQGWRPGLLDYQGADGCALFQGARDDLHTVRAVLKNPLTPPEQRFFYIEADPGHLDAILNSIQFTHPFTNDQSYSFLPNPMRVTDQPFWDTPRKFPAGMAIAEYPVIANGTKYPGDLISDAPWGLALLDRTKTWRKDDTPDRHEKTIAALSRFGYQMAQNGQSATGLPLFSLTHGSVVLFTDLHEFGQVSISASGHDFAVVVSSLKTGDWLVQNNRVTPWNTDLGRAMFFDPVFGGEDLLDLVWNNDINQVQVVRAATNVPIFSSVVFYGAIPFVFLFTEWQGHWLLEADGILYQDGINQNQALSYDEIFGWQLLNNQPVYFFRKGSKVGVNFAGQILPMQYDEVFHHGCCGFGFNPYAEQYVLQYYALHDGTWYFVELGYPEN